MSGFKHWLDDELDQFYDLLKSKVTGQVINGTLTGVLLEFDLEEIYEKFRNPEGDSLKEVP
jgi:hypothetical protein